MNQAQFNYLQPYFLENGYLPCKPFTIPTILLPLNTEEAQALGQSLAIPSEGRLDALNTTLAKAMRKLVNEEPVFVRLGTRSPKDVPDFRAFRGRTRLSYEAIGWLRSSQRVADDLAACRRYGYPPTVAVREWLDIPLWSEFRCFVRKGEVVGLSQLHLHIGPAPEIIEAAAGIELAAHNFVSEFVHETKRWTCALDLFIKPGQDRDWVISLIEINPMMPLTDSLLFSWQGHDMEGSFRYLETTETAV
ncbi:MAG: cell division cycle 123 family protein [Candidatus Thiodiazotropha sp. (ex Lucinoma kastoroae)]|nr:cell division cycle 123 family protein [Candidatus Thiodiazotropha sp. (ex Lucinoma kastoroae)]